MLPQALNINIMPTTMASFANIFIMKSIKEILSSDRLKHSEAFKKNGIQKSCAKFKLLLPMHLQSRVLFVFVRNDIVKIAFDSTSASSEYNKFYAKDNLDFIKDNLELAKTLGLESIIKCEAYTPKDYLLSYVKIPKVRIYERSKGNFPIILKDEKLCALMERYKELVKHNLRHNEDLDRKDF
ncbi:hypothetical protein [Helicobacter sp. 11S02629-2]|uniref:hypothetical protein n=1 Tax=Helicobacter sp. 11S02629-2 TaxID=1476195 RepID=UPI000BA69EDF|nr:hypothetical protein [Helicobacter sp. 11S02629-2]PAF44065.1 hypothetical protein BKH40_06240 [Helicobacter sp. 11S02629-2]